jgi:replicative DNA helicase
MADGASIPPSSAGPNKTPTEEGAPLSIEAEQAVLGAILFDNEVYYRVSSFLKPEHFYDPVHAVIYDACARLINSGRVAAPTIVESFLSSSQGFREAGGRRFLESLAANTPSTASAPDYAKVVFDLAVRRGLMTIGGEMIERARAVSLDDETDRQVEDAEQALYKLAETGKYGGGFKTFRAAIAEAIELADAAVRRDGGLAGVTTGLRDLDNMLGGLHPSDLIILSLIHI